MNATRLDLESGDTIAEPEPVEPAGDDDEAAPYGRKEDGTARAKPGRKPKDGSAKKRGGDEPAGARSRRRDASELQARMTRTLDRLAEALEGRGDRELAGIIREDGPAITGGLVALTKPVKWLVSPLTVALAIAEPLLAFGRVARVLAGRWRDRRLAHVEAYREANAALAIEHPGGTWSDDGLTYFPPEGVAGNGA